MKISEEVEFEAGTVIYEDFDYNPNESFEAQEFSFKEDLLQVKLDDNHLVDVGWSPEFDENGFFTIQVIRSKDWENPLIKRTEKEFEQLVSVLKSILLDWNLKAE